ncbi:hypothetical protein [Streptococcus sp. X13SY08]|nr:hypothetical protein [Streptococcus sp. X13SY08]
MNEINVLTSRHGWTKDNGGRPVFYSGGNVNIYRVYNQKLRGLHHWTTDSNEYNVLPGHGWSQEGVKFKATYTGRQIRTHFFDPYARVIEGYVENSDIITLKAEDAYDWADYVINDPESDFSGFNSFEIITIKASNGGITHSVQFSY